MLVPSPDEKGKRTCERLRAGADVRRLRKRIRLFMVIDEIKGSGFELVQVISDWPGRGPLQSYCAVFRRPLTGVSTYQPVSMKEES
jgi:hypothetical protein